MNDESKRYILNQAKRLCSRQSLTFEEMLLSLELAHGLGVRQQIEVEIDRTNHLMEITKR